MDNATLVRDIKIQNFKCFQDKEIQLNQLTILAGANAVGKSTIIQSLLLIRQTYDILSHEKKITPRKNPSFNILLNGPYNLNLGNSAQVIASNASSNEISFTLNSDTLSYPIRYTVSKNEPEIVINYNHNENYESELETMNLTIFNRGFYYLNAERLGPRIVQNIESQDFDNTGAQGEFTGYVLSKNQTFKVDERRKFISESKEKKVPSLDKQTEYWIDFIIPGIEISNVFFKDLNLVGCYVKRTYSDTEPLNPNNIGFGISYVLPIIVSGLVANEGSMLIVENPEAHLHPSGQSKIGQFLAQMAASGVQVLIETHSEHVINGIRIAILKNKISNDSVSANFFSMDKKSKTPDIENISFDKKGKLSQWPRGFFDQEENDLAEIFQRSKNDSKSLSPQ